MVEETQVDYKCTLNKELQAIAFDELREDENIRSQSLEQFRSWILKNPSIKRCRTDPLFLLRFLRTKKFSVPLAQVMLERYLQSRQMFSDFFQNLDINDPDIEAVIDNGYIVPLLERDQYRRRVFLVRNGRFDPYKHTVQHMVRAYTLTFESELNDEENQVLGYVYVNDQSGLTMAHASLISATQMKNIFSWVQNGIPVRHKKSYIVNVPSYGTKVLNFCLSFLSKKLRQRIENLATLDDLRKRIDPKILPKEYGGEVPLADMITVFKDNLRRKREEVKALDDMYIEISPNDKCLISDSFGGISGSFRKLEVD